MTAVSMFARRGGEWVLVHQCVVCGVLKSNRIAGDDNAVALMRVALRPLADPHFGHHALRAL